MIDAWEQALARYAALLDDIERRIASESWEDVAAPVELARPAAEPTPVQRERAAALMRRAESVGGRLRAAMAAKREDLTGVARRRDAAGAYLTND